MSEDDINMNLKYTIIMGIAVFWLRAVPSSGLLFHERWEIS
jgi:hypothetical protein